LSTRFLIKDSPYYQGDIIKHAEIMWRNWSELDSIVKKGKPVHTAHNHEAFIKGMHNIASLKAGKIIKNIDLKGVKKALDLGGGPGTYSIEMAKKGISVTLFDKPETIKIAKGIVSRSMIKNINFMGGDFLSDRIGDGYDLIFISQILHAYSERDNIAVIKKSKSALNPKGRIVIQEFYLEKDRTHPLQGALFSVNMLVNTEGGRSYSPPEIKQWLSKAGLKNINIKMIDDCVLVSAVN
ncbi:MAG: methyltransferase domain-containing protein, partial [Nitrospirae bacterium]|nr:methyltransferase domain-containing protein [Nitrospirota bacterium]